LVTGAAGYIGAVLTPMLLAEGFSVIALDNFLYGQTSLLDCCHDVRLRIVRGDARDEDLLRRLLAECDAVIPLACIVGAPACDQRPVEARSINCDAVERLLCLSRPEQPIIFPNTNSGYGIGAPDAPCTEESPLRPVSLYGRLKIEAERAVLSSGRGVSLRLATVFGISPRMRLDLLVNDFVYRAVTDRFVVLFEPHFRRNYLHVRDAARAFIHALHHWEDMRGEAYNVGLSEANLTKRELCEEIRRQVPDFVIFEAPVGRDPDRRDYLVCNEKIERMGFRPRIRLAEGIAELIKGYQVVRRAAFSNG
jgi:nucleoside-diphosphate-sugar epimerase